MRYKTFLTLAATIALGRFALPAFAASDLPLRKGHEYLAVTNYPNNLNVVDAETDSMYKTCTLPDKFGPGTVQISPDRSRAYVLNNHYGDLYGVELDTCKVVFHAALAQDWSERAKAFFSIGLSRDGKEIYSIVNPTRMNRDNYAVETPRLQVYATDAGLEAKPARTFPAPRQTTLLQAADDGSLFVVGADVYKMDPATGKTEVAIPLRHWTRPLYGAPDVLSAWPQQRPQHTFNLLFTAERYRDENKEPEGAEVVYGYIDIDLRTGKSEVTDFGPFTEVFFTGGRSPKDPNLMFGVLNHLAKYDIREKKLIQSAPLDHSYYCLSLNKAGTKIYLAGTFNTVAVYDADSMRKLKDVNLPGADMAITTAQIFTR
ncbi:quinohemoprotein amine dehydrogenase subunit beta [Cupriavidus basilensis]|uniref:Quinohemoprotein amine dehydrogenase subunit beta n=1 Tax=Cupriavidus basilensis TaxID=68895 RepID=A0A643FKF3_9BURK|nr:quinohemoprotein amine dehydrogenase subunit beta [Cupriavidus basilensis]QOT82046.1 quinohemoprotein amine dehydrogenase subunit beta [Cupriavidus basilensis]